MDGAMGTQLIEAGLPPGECCEAWNLGRPDVVQAIHQAYVEAGAQCLLTNTFQAHPFALARHGLADCCEEIIAKAIAIARSVAGSGRAVIAAFGPVEDGWQESSWQRVVRASHGIDGLLLETFSDPQSLWLVKLVCLPISENVPVLLSISYQKTRQGIIATKSGHPPETFARLASQYGVSALGVNCGREIGFAELVSVLQRYRQETDLPLFVRPNAGTPLRAGDHWEYPVTPTTMAYWAPGLIAAGAEMIGGCCGTTPEHIREMGKKKPTERCPRA